MEEFLESRNYGKFLVVTPGVEANDGFLVVAAT